jgi:hypothetical protein
MEKANMFKRMGALAIAVGLIAVITTTFVSASEDTSPDTAVQNQQTQNGPGFDKPSVDPEFEAKMTEVMNSGDYAAWVTLMEEKASEHANATGDKDDSKHEKITSIITEDEFPQFVAAWKLKEEGRALMEQAKAKMDEAKTIEESLGLTRPEGRHGHRGFGIRPLNGNTSESGQNTSEDTQNTQE